MVHSSVNFITVTSKLPIIVKVIHIDEPEIQSAVRKMDQEFQIVTVLAELDLSFKCGTLS